MLVTDVVMPRMGGRDPAVALMRLRPNLRVLFVSGYADSAIDPAALPARSAFLPKPFTPEALLSNVQALFELWTADDGLRPAV